jgi:hypothetical protein
MLPEMSESSTGPFPGDQLADQHRREASDDYCG